MAREWQPGDADLAIISWESPSGRSGGTGMAMRCSHDYNEAHWTTQMLGEVQDENVTSWRPLVVIDPEDRAAVERLRDLWDAAHEVQEGRAPSPAHKGNRGNCLQAALREFANPTPPKPEEPLGRYAVVIDADNREWVRGHDGQWHLSHPALKRKPYSEFVQRSWGRIDAVRVLSEGVQP
jgi:hypothetical protein